MCWVCESAHVGQVCVRIMSFQEPEAKIWKEVAAVAEQEGFTLYDLFKGSGKVQVFLNGVDSDDCFRICKRLVTLFKVKGVELGVGEEPAVEVSSPGLTRQLRRAEHFEQAIGKKISVVSADGQKYIGTLKKVSDEGFALDKEGSEQSVAFENLKKANLEF